MGQQVNVPPTVYVIAGPNGAGKTTFAREFLPDIAHCREFVNADLIAAGLSPFAPDSQAMRAGRLVLTRIRELSENRKDFSFETTLSGRTYAPLLAAMRANGYRVTLFFLWLPDADLAVARVANRVRQGGHDIPEAVIRRRFNLGVRNLIRCYRPLLDVLWVFDATQAPPVRIVREEEGRLDVDQPDLYEMFMSYESH
jgi:predicted ABC-type ATPase